MTQSYPSVLWDKDTILIEKNGIIYGFCGDFRDFYT